VANSKRVAGLVGPTLAVVTLSETEFINPHLYDNQIAPVVYLSGALLFLAGLSIVRVHNRWTGGWPVLVTLTGWLALLVGLFRLFATGLYPRSAGNSTSMFVVEMLGFAMGMFLTFKAYWRDKSELDAR